VLPCQKLAELRSVDERLAASAGDEAAERCDLSERSRASTIEAGPPAQEETKPTDDAEEGSEIHPGTGLVPCGGISARMDPPRLAPRSSIAA